MTRFSCDNRPLILDVCCVGGSVIIELLYRREGCSAWVKNADESGILVPMTYSTFIDTLVRLRRGPVWAVE